MALAFACASHALLARFRSLGSDVSENQVERPRHVREIEGVDEQACVSDLPAAAAAHPAPKLLLRSPSLPCRLLLKSAERSKVPLGLSDPLHGVGAERADQLVLQICNAHVEAEPLHVDACQVGAETGSLETAAEVTLLTRIAEASQPDVEPIWAELGQEPPDGLRASDRHDGNALGVEVAATTIGERFQCVLVANPFDEHDCLRPGRLHSRILPVRAERTLA